jgi:hypothetical protein
MGNTMFQLRNPFSMAQWSLDLGQIARLGAGLEHRIFKEHCIERSHP